MRDRGGRGGRERTEEGRKERKQTKSNVIKGQELVIGKQIHKETVLQTEKQTDRGHSETQTDTHKNSQ